MTSRSTAQIDLASFTPEYDRFKSEVSSFNMHAIDTFQEIALTLKSFSPEMTEDLIKALNTLKFKDAEVIIKSFDKLINEENSWSFKIYLSLLR